MSQFPHDQFAKNLLESLLSPFGLVQIAFTMSSEIREIDVYFTPDSLPTNLGLLSQCAATSAVFEPFRNPVSVFEIRSCMSKLYDLHAEIGRQAKINSEEQELIMQLSPLYLEKIQAAEQRGEQRGELKGRQTGELALTLKLLQKRFGTLDESIQGQIAGLSVERLEDLVEELLDFNTVEELVGWLIK